MAQSMTYQQRRAFRSRRLPLVTELRTAQHAAMTAAADYRRRMDEFPRIESAPWETCPESGYFRHYPEQRGILKGAWWRSLYLARACRLQVAALTEGSNAP